MNALAWLDNLPAELAPHGVVLRRLLAAVERDPRWRLLELSSSVARGAGDADSDLDLGLGADDEAWPQILAAVPSLVSGLGEAVDALHHRIPEWGDRPHQRTFVQYANGVQVDLVAYPASLRSKGRPPDTVVLYDPDGRLARQWTPPSYQADAATVREWTFLGWTALGDTTKYLRRGSAWEALERLRQAREQVWRLWAVARGVAYPAFGLTSVLDAPPVGLPPGIEATVAGLDLRDLHRAALACATLLDQTARLAAPVVGADPPMAMAAFVRQRLYDDDEGDSNL